MTDKALFDLDAKGRYCLAYDNHQWIIRKRSTNRGDGAGNLEPSYHGTKFIGGSKKGLWRCFRDLEIILTDDAIAQIDTMPDSFLRFLVNHDVETARHHPAIIYELERRFGNKGARGYTIEPCPDGLFRPVCRKPVKGTPQADEANSGTQPPETAGSPPGASVPAPEGL